MQGVEEVVRMFGGKPGDCHTEEAHPAGSPVAVPASAMAASRAPQFHGFILANQLRVAATLMKNRCPFHTICI